MPPLTCAPKDMSHVQIIGLVEYLKSHSGAGVDDPFVFWKCQLLPPPPPPAWSPTPLIDTHLPSPPPLPARSPTPPIPTCSPSPPPPPAWSPTPPVPPHSPILSPSPPLSPPIPPHSPPIPPLPASPPIPSCSPIPPPVSKHARRALAANNDLPRWSSRNQPPPGPQTRNKGKWGALLEDQSSKPVSKCQWYMFSIIALSLWLKNLDRNKWTVGIGGLKTSSDLSGFEMSPAQDVSRCPHIRHGVMYICMNIHYFTSQDIVSHLESKMILISLSWDQWVRFLVWTQLMGARQRNGQCPRSDRRIWTKGVWCQRSRHHQNRNFWQTNRHDPRLQIQGSLLFLPCPIEERETGMDKTPTHRNKRWPYSGLLEQYMQ